jgi:hypothetical protein
MEMSDANQAGDPKPDADDGAEESAVIRALRKELKEKDADLKVALESVDTIAEQTRAEMKRSQDAAAIVNALGYPKMANDFASQVEGELTADAGVAFLESKGLEPRPLDAQDDTGMVDTGAPADLAKDLAATANLGSRVANAATGAGATGAAQRTEKQLDETESADAVAEVMRDAGLLN